MADKKIKNPVLDSVKVYRREKRAGTLKKLKSLKDLAEDKSQIKSRPYVVDNFSRFMRV